MLCFLSGKKEGKKHEYEIGSSLIHHIFSVAIYPELCLNPYNLISLCDDCHENIYRKYKDNFLLLQENLKNNKKINQVLEMEKPPKEECIMKDRNKIKW